MKTSLFGLPLASLFVLALGGIGSTAFPDKPLIQYVTWALAAGLVGLWVAMDLENFRRVFRRKGAKYGASSGLVVILGALVILGVGMLAKRPRFNKSLDLSQSKANTLSDPSLKAVATLKERGVEVAVEAFFVSRDVEASFRDLVSLYEMAGASLKVTYHDPQAERALAESEKLTSLDTVIVRSQGQESRLTVFTEEKMTNALVRVLKAKDKKVYFTSGHGEGPISGSEHSGYDEIVQELRNNRYEVAELSLMDGKGVPEDASLVVVAGPQYDLKSEETQFLRAYLQRGGALLVMEGAMVPVDEINKLLAEFGIRYQEDFLILDPNDLNSQLYGQDATFLSNFDEFHPITKDFARQSRVNFVLQRSRSLAKVTEGVSDKIKVETPAESFPGAVRIRNVRRREDLQPLSQDRLEDGSFPVIAVATGRLAEGAKAEGSDDDKKDDAAESGADANGRTSDESNKGPETRIVAVGSSAFATNGGAVVKQNRDLFMNMVSYLLQDEDFISIRPKDPEKGGLDLETPMAKLSLAFFSWIYSFFFLAGGILYWLSRRRA